MMYHIEDIRQLLERTFPNVQWNIRTNPQQTLVHCTSKVSFLYLEIRIAEIGAEAQCTVKSGTSGIILERIDLTDVDECLRLFNVWICEQVEEIEEAFRC